MRALILMALLCSASAVAQTNVAQSKRILYITHSAGFRHGSIEHSIDVLRTLATSRDIQLTATEDVSQINAANLANYDAILFFTSGELPISAQQKADLLAFVRSGHGFGGFHSATDTFYQWPEYGELIGGYFNGHPWTQEVSITVAYDHPLVLHHAAGFRITDEIYQFRDFARDRVRVLLKLDTSTVNLNAEGVNPNTTDFPLVWTRDYGQGRVFYSALGHFDEVWDHPQYRETLLKAMLYLAGAPQLFANWAGNAADYQPWGEISPGSAFTVFGENLTGGKSAAGDPHNPPLELAGTRLLVNNEPVPLFFAAPGQINAYLPFDRQPRLCPGGMPGFCRGPWFDLRLLHGDWTGDVRLLHKPSTPGIFIYTRDGNYLTFWGTGLGPVERRGDLDWLVNGAGAAVGFRDAAVPFSGLAPAWFGLYQVNVEIPAGSTFPASVRLDAGGRTFFFNVPE